MRLETDSSEHADMQRNLRLLPWWWVLRWAWMGEAIWVVYLLQERGLTLGQVFLFESMLGIFTIVGEIPTGMFADRYGRRISIAIGTAAVVIAFLAFGTGAAFWILLISYAFLGVAESFFSGADSAMLFDSLKALGRGDEYASWEGRLNALVTGGIGAFTIVGAVMVHWLPLWTPIIASAVLCLPAVALALMMREPPREGERHSYFETGRQALARVGRRPGMLALMVLMAMTTFSIAFTMIALQPIVIDVYGLPVWTLGLFASSSMAMGALGALVAARTGRRLGARHIFWMAPVGAALSLLAGASGIVWLFPIFILPNLAWNLMWPHFVDYISRRVSDSLRATTISIANLISGAGYAMVIPLLGVSVDAQGLRTTLVVASLAFALVAGLVYALWRSGGDLEVTPRFDAPPAAAVP